MTKPKILQLDIGPMMNFTYLIVDDTTKTAAVVDPSWHADAIFEAAQKEGATITHLLLTHSHFDHTNAVSPLMEKTGAVLCVHAEEAADFEKYENRLVPLNDNDTVRVGTLEFQVIHTPGHTPGSVCYLIGHTCFTGDTLFVDSIGRTDLPGGDPEEMFASLKRLSELPNGVVIFPGHNYGGSTSATIEEQRKTNPYMKLRSVGDFLRMA